MTTYTPPPLTPVQILYQDEYLLAVNKPAGLLSVPGRGPDKQDCLISRIQADFPEALTVHRLDMGTSGIMLLALGKPMERELSILFQQRRVHKQYLAIVAGKMQPESGEIHLPLITDWPNRPRQMVSFELGKPSCTRYRAIAYDRNSDTTRAELEPVTGRSHQLRVHMQSLGNPILGDELYAPQDVHARAERLLLHAFSIKFPHPFNGENLTIRCEAPF